jgi:alkylated DNA repair dioxygenase AlkB
MSKRTLDAFFKSSTSSPSPSVKKLKENTTSDPPPTTTKTNKDIDDDDNGRAALDANKEEHPSYPFSIAQLPSHVSVGLEFATPDRQPRAITNEPHLDLLYYEPYIPQTTAKQYFQFLRRELPFYRVKYTIKRGPTETLIKTPRFTTVFGVDITSYFSAADDHDNRDRKLLDSKTHRPIAKDKYKCSPRPIPACLDLLRKQVEAALDDGTTYNFVLVNYYASGDDSISYHSDDERFLGTNPNIASLTLGAKRDFLMKHKSAAGVVVEKPLKLPLGSGDLIVMRGETQSNWLHSIPKRKGGEAGSGRINITLRKAVVPGGTENYYRYNVGDGDMYRWDDARKEMLLAD